ncbi:hypothetical protein AB0B97_29790 [Micromonospora sp. NPDC049004]|uniref:hypothetical protein n=1 Tax=Micromonospora sp. NPDC049004 TaxID=3154348 RepID=UPI0033E7A454
MTTAEKITAVIALLAALGVGALLPMLVGHLLGRGEKKVNIADKSVQMAETLMTRMEAEITRAEEALGRARRENQELQAELTKATASMGRSLNPQERSIRRRLSESDRELEASLNALARLQGDVQKLSEGEIERLSRYLDTSPELRMRFMSLYMELHEARSKRGDGNGTGGTVSRQRH